MVPLLQEALVLVHSMRAPTLRADLSDASATSWVASREGSAGARCLETLCNEAGFTPRIVYRSNDYDVVRALVAAGLGVAVVPALAYAHDPAVRAVPLPLDNATRTVFVTYREHDDSPLIETVTRAFRNASRALARDLPDIVATGPSHGSRLARQAGAQEIVGHR